jgi:hypothetical protein
MRFNGNFTNENLSYVTCVVFIAVIHLPVAEADA